MAAETGKVGPYTASDGVETAIRLTRESAVAVQDAHARFQEAVERGNCYSASAQATVVTQAGLSATTPALTLFNPANSGVNMVLWFAGAASLVAPVAAALFWLATNSVVTAAATTGTATAIRNCLMGNAASGKVQALLTATLPAAPLGSAILGAQLTAAITTAPNGSYFSRWFDGAFVFQPNTAVSIQTSTASTIFSEFIWEERPV